MENTLYYDLGKSLKSALSNITDEEKRIVNNILIDLNLDDFEYDRIEFSSTPIQLSHLILYIIRMSKYHPPNLD